MILPRFWRRSQGTNIHALYGMIVAQARSPVFYAAFGVPDSVDGRFDLIVLHLVLTMRRLGRHGEAGRSGGQELFDLFCRDLDANLREMGVGDLAVPKEMRRLGEAFYGRQSAYQAALGGADEQELANALARNIFPASLTSTGAASLADYTRAAVHELDAQDGAGLLRGEIVFPDPEAFAHDLAPID
jgi:cytochrome b pre-mRNA-processing protein 3